MASLCSHSQACRAAHRGPANGQGVAELTITGVPLVAEPSAADSLASSSWLDAACMPSSGACSAGAGLLLSPADSCGEPGTGCCSCAAAGLGGGSSLQAGLW